MATCRQRHGLHIVNHSCGAKTLVEAWCDLGTRSDQATPQAAYIRNKNGNGLLNLQCHAAGPQ